MNFLRAHFLNITIKIGGKSQRESHSAALSSVSLIFAVQRSLVSLLSLSLSLFAIIYAAIIRPPPPHIFRDLPPSSHFPLLPVAFRASNTSEL